MSTIVMMRLMMMMTTIGEYDDKINDDDANDD